MTVSAHDRQVRNCLAGSFCEGDGGAVISIWSCELKGQIADCARADEARAPYVVRCALGSCDQTTPGTAMPLKG